MAEFQPDVVDYSTGKQFNNSLLEISTVLLAAILSKYGTDNSDDLIVEAVNIGKKLIKECDNSLKK